MSDARTILDTFTLDSLPTLDVAVTGALELFDAEPPTPVQLDFACPLVVGSVGARYAAGIMFADTDAVFADESDFLAVYERNKDRIDGAVLVSSSGGKHAPGIAKGLADCGIRTVLLTNSPIAPAAKYVKEDDVYVFSRNREPYTYNTSTYLGMVLSVTGERAGMIKSHVSERTATELADTDFEPFSAFTFIVPSRFSGLVPMLRTKFDELFGPFVTGRVFTEEEVKHAKTVMTSESEHFVALGVKNDWFGMPQNRLQLSLPEGTGYGAALSVGYYAVGRIQADLPPYFADNIDEYTKRASELFGHTISPIVE